MIASSFIYVTLEGATSSVFYLLDDYTHITNQEDFLVVLAIPTEREVRAMREQRHQSAGYFGNQQQANHYFISDYYQDLATSIAEKFNVDLEGRFYYDAVETIQDQTHTFRFIRETEIVNQTYVLEGRLPTADHEIAIFPEYANQNHLLIGDTLTINEQPFAITAFIMLPDYIYPIFSFDSPLFNPQTQTIIIATDQIYEQFAQGELVLFSGSFRDEANPEEMVAAISNYPGVSYAMDNQMNVRISTLNFHLHSNHLLSITFSNLLLLMCVAVVLLMMKKRINGDRMQIGILKAMGYSQGSLIISYLIFPLVIAIIGSIIGFFLGIGCARFLANTYVVNFVLPPVQFYFTPRLFIRGVLYPILVTVGASLIILHRLLKGESLSLMKENNHLKLSIVSKGLSKLLRPFSFSTRFKYSLAFRNLGKVIALFIVVLVASIFLVFGFIAFNAVDDVSDRAFNRANYTYEIKYNRLVRQSIGAGETEFLKYQAYPELEVVSTPFYIYGIDPNNEVNPLYNGQAENITSLANEGLLINEFIAKAYSLEVGDELTMVIRGKQLTYPISGIVDHYNGPMTYISLDWLRQDLNIGTSQYNGSWTQERPDNTRHISYVFSMEELAQNVEAGMEMIRVTLQFMVVITVLIGNFMLVVLTNFVIEENQKQISILKVMGYSEREVSKMVLTIYFPFVLMAYFLSVLITRVGVDLIMSQIANRLPMAIPTDFTIGSTLTGAIIVALTYLIAIKCSKRQLAKVSLQEVLKY